MIANKYLLVSILCLFVHCNKVLRAGETPAERGYRLLITKSYLPPDFDQQTFDEIWNVWPEPLRSQAEKATPEERRQIAFARYGLTERPDDESGKPLQYVVDDEGNWVMNCFSCHGGQVAGQVIPGLPNAHFALQTLTEETRATKLRAGRRPWGKELTSLFFPLGGSNGTTNAVMFGVALKAFRDDDLNIVVNRPRPKLVHHDMDAPSWWHFKKRKKLYIDGFATKDHRALMPFLMVKENGPEKFPEWEDDFRDIYAYLESLHPPKYPFDIDQELANNGELIFNDHCSRCHGVYGTNESYPHRVVPIEEIGTDRVRLDALSVEHRVSYGQSWFAHHGEHDTVAKPEGYLAPPLDGVWASAPYFHNGSVPTLWHVLHPDNRPVVWRRTIDSYDQTKVGLSISEFESVPKDAKTAAEKRNYFNTRRFAKNSNGHRFPDQLNDAEKDAVLEYLKSL